MLPINSWHHTLELVTLRSYSELQCSTTHILHRGDHRWGRKVLVLQLMHHTPEDLARIIPTIHDNHQGRSTLRCRWLYYNARLCDKNQTQPTLTRGGIVKLKLGVSEPDFNETYEVVTGWASAVVVLLHGHIFSHIQISLKNVVKCGNETPQAGRARRSDRVKICGLRKKA